MIHKPQPQLNILTPLPDVAPFTEQSINKAFNFWVNPQNWVLGQKLLAINFDLNQVLFTWAFDDSFKSSFILVYTCKGQFFNDDDDPDEDYDETYDCYDIITLPEEYNSLKIYLYRLED